MSRIDPIISAAALAALPAGAVLPVDCRSSLEQPDWGAQVYRQGHLPGAVYADLERDLAMPPPRAAGLGRHPLPAPAAFAACLSAWGWQPGQLLVAYDVAGGAMAAARLWWLAHWLGIEQVAVLDGGLSAWQSAGLPLETGLTQITPSAEVSLLADPGMLMESAELLNLPKSTRYLLLDARNAARFRGEVEPIDPIAGHVPGAKNRPFTANLDSQGRFLPAEQLRQEFTALLAARPVSTLVHMCGSGVTACHNLLAMERAGLHGSRLYAASWSGWLASGGAAASGG